MLHLINFETGIPGLFRWGDLRVFAVMNILLFGYAFIGLPFNVYLPLILSLPLLWLFWILLYSSYFVISM